MTSLSEAPLGILSPARLIPLLHIERLDDAVPLARVLVEAGLPVLEIALRTKVAAQAIKRILETVPGAVPCAGNVMTPHDLGIARSAGAPLLLSPGASDELLEAAVAENVPFVPGIATPTELMHVISKGFHIVKFFPAVPFGGSATLRAFAGPFPRVLFMPTGGTSELDYDDWLSIPSVIAVGGSWLAPLEDIERRDWEHIGRRARYAVSKFNLRRVR
jgi:2-dehydro-3-deoxyphosphogluconate aldolase / (4S)-4-hydroxy-2-oxoglutarate aldolase